MSDCHALARVILSNEIQRLLLLPQSLENEVSIERMRRAIQALKH